MFENVDGRTDGRTDDRRTDGRRTTDAGVTGILIAHLGAFGSGELKSEFPVRFFGFVTVYRGLLCTHWKFKKRSSCLPAI